MPKYTYDVEHMESTYKEAPKYWCVTVSYKLWNSVANSPFRRESHILLFHGSFSEMLWLANNGSTNHGYFKMDSFTEIDEGEFIASSEFTDRLEEYKERVMKAEEEFE